MANFTITNIHDKSFFSQLILRPIGIAANYANWKLGQYEFFQKHFGLDGRHVEKDMDKYEGFYLVAKDLFANHCMQLPRSMQVRLDNDPLFQKEQTLGIYTFAKRLPSGDVMPRQIFVNSDQRKLFDSITDANDHCDKIFTLMALGQYWGSFRPRLQYVTASSGDIDECKGIISDMACGTKRVLRAPVARFMTPKQ